MNCGGCDGQGAHKRWCAAVVGLPASIYGPMAEQLESMGDRVGPNNHELANRLWSLSGAMRTWARELAEQAEGVSRRDGGSPNI